MRSLAIILFLLCSNSVSAQTECEVDGIPCYQYYLDVDQVEGVGRSPKRWRAYKKTIEEVYQTDTAYHNWRRDFPEGGFALISAIVLTGPDRPYTVLEELEYEWGGKFYSKDFIVITEALFKKANDPFPK